MALIKQCDNNDCDFTEPFRAVTAVKTYKVIMQNEDDNADVMYHHSTDLCPECVEKIRTAMQESLNIAWVIVDPADRKNVANGGQAVAPAVTNPIENESGIGKKFNY